MGSSITKDLDGRKLFKNRNTRITTLRDKTVRGAIEYIHEKKIRNDISVIMFQIGSNDLDNAEAGEVIEEYEQLVDQTSKNYPNAEIVLGQILPRFYRDHLDTEIFETKRNQFNLLLKDLCSDRNFKLVCYDDMRPDDFYDGIHLNQEGIKNFVKNFKCVVSPLVDVILPQQVEQRRQFPRTTLYNAKFKGHGTRQFGNSQSQNSGMKNNQSFINNNLPNQYDQSGSFYQGNKNYQNWNNNRNYYRDNNLYNLLELFLCDRNGQGFR